MNIIQIPEVGSIHTGGVAGAFHTAFNVVKNRDFSILKIVLFGIVCCIPFVLLFLVVRGRIRGINFNFGDGFGLKLITGTFGAGKTKFTFLNAYLWKKFNPHGILIANMPYDFVDIKFDSVKDFKFILKDLCQYIRDTNSEDFLKGGFPPIKVITDEAHIYLFARDFKSFTKNSLILLTQCRKRDLGIDFITQELGQLDVFIRRLCPYIQYYQEAFRLGKDTVFVKQSILYSKDVEQTTITSENGFEEIDYSYLLPFNWTAKFKKKLLTPYFDQKFLTYYVVGDTDVYANDSDDEDDKVSHNYQEFYNKLSGKRELYLHLKSIKEKSLLEKLKLFFDNFLMNTKYGEKIKKRKEIDLNSQKFLIDLIREYLGDDKFTELLQNKQDYDINTGFSDNLLIDDLLSKQTDIITYLLDSMSDEDVNNLQSFYRTKLSEKQEAEYLLKLQKLLDVGFTLKDVVYYDDIEGEMSYKVFVSPDGKEGFFSDMYWYALDHGLIKEND